MIFVTIGTQEPFDRLIKVMDEIAAELGGEPVIAQMFEATYQVQHMKVLNFVSPTEFKQLFSEARLVVSHAGMGTIISALTDGKPLLVMPRKVSLGEHRNDHQMATAKKMGELGYVRVAYDETELKEQVRALLNLPSLQPVQRAGDWASNELISSLRQFVQAA